MHYVHHQVEGGFGGLESRLQLLDFGLAEWPSCTFSRFQALPLNRLDILFDLRVRRLAVIQNRGKGRGMRNRLANPDLVWGE
jgi:hypothetical protein